MTYVCQGTEQTFEEIIFEQEESEGCGLKTYNIKRKRKTYNG